LFNIYIDYTKIIKGVIMEGRRERTRVGKKECVVHDGVGSSKRVGRRNEE